MWANLKDNLKKDKASDVTDELMVLPNGPLLELLQKPKPQRIQALAQVLKKNRLTFRLVLSFTLTRCLNSVQVLAFRVLRTLRLRPS